MSQAQGPARAPACPLATGWRPLTVDFSATGAEYARLWQVNLLLTLLTLGLYLPFAKARRLRYLYAHTWVGGHPLGFHGDPWRMLGGHLTMVVLFGGYTLSGYASPWVYLASAVALALAWPALWRAGLRYRLANTRWRGLRFAFVGDVRGAYRAMLPWTLPPVLFGVCTLLWAPNTLAGETPDLPPWVWALNIAVFLGALPLGLAWVKRYQTSGYRWGGLVPHTEVRTADFYGLLLRVLGLGVLGLLVALVLVMAGLFGLGELLQLPQATKATLSYVATICTVYWVGLVGTGAQLSAGVQNIVWNATTAPGLRVQSSLDVAGYVWLQLKNWLWVALTLGLYRPYAWVRAQRMRWAAIQMQASVAPQGWHTTTAADANGAAGEMSGDFFGLDVGW